MWQNQVDQQAMERRANGEALNLLADVTGSVGIEELRIGEFLDAGVNEGDAEEESQGRENPRGNHGAGRAPPIPDGWGSLWRMVGVTGMTGCWAGRNERRLGRLGAARWLDLARSLDLLFHQSPLYHASKI